MQKETFPVTIPHNSLHQTPAEIATRTVALTCRRSRRLNAPHPDSDPQPAPAATRGTQSSVTGRMATANVPGQTQNEQQSRGVSMARRSGRHRGSSEADSRQPRAGLTAGPARGPPGCSAWSFIIYFIFLKAAFGPAATRRRSRMRRLPPSTADSALLGSRVAHCPTCCCSLRPNRLF